MIREGWRSEIHIDETSKRVNISLLTESETICLENENVTITSDQNGIYIHCLYTARNNSSNRIINMCQ